MWRRSEPADEVPTAAMKIGDLVLYQGELYYLRGLDPMGVPERRAQLEHPGSGELIVAPLDEVGPAPQSNGFARSA